MAEPYLGEIRLFATNFAPKGWAKCEGQTLSIQQNTALFSLLGTTYGGNGTTTFALPDLRGRVPIHFNSDFPPGEAQGEASHTLTSNEMPTHTHTVSGSSATGSSSPNGQTWGTYTTAALYGQALPPLAPMNTGAVTTSGSSQAHPNMQPYQVLNFCIALQGIFPPRN